MPAKPWPTCPEILPVEQILNPIKRTLLAGYRVIRRKGCKSVPYDGYELGPVGRACDSTVGEDRFQEDYLAYHAERGRDLLDVVLSTLFQLGFEQGRRYTLDDMAPKLRRLKRYEEREAAEFEREQAALTPEQRAKNQAEGEAIFKKLWEESGKKK